MSQDPSKAQLAKNDVQLIAHDFCRNVQRIAHESPQNLHKISTIVTVMRQKVSHL